MKVIIGVETPKNKVDMLKRIEWLERELVNQAELHKSEIASLKHGQDIRESNFMHSCQVRDYLHEQNRRLLNILENCTKEATFPRRGS